MASADKKQSARFEEAAVATKANLIPTSTTQIEIHLTTNIEKLGCTPA